MEPDRDRAPLLRGVSWAPVVGTALLVALSLWGLASKPLWLDEAFTVGATMELGRTLRETAGTMGLYYAVVTPWSKVAGISAAAARLPSVLFVALALPAVHAVARRCLRRDEAAVAVLVAAAMPALTRYAQEARSYGLVLLLTAVSWWCLLRAVAPEAGDRSPRRWWVAFTVLSVCGVLAHGLYALQLAAQAASLLVLPRRWSRLKAMAPALVGAATCLVGLAALGADDIASWVKPLNLRQVLNVTRELAGRPQALTGAVLVLSVAGAVILACRRVADPLERWHRLVPVIWAFAPPVGLIAMSAVRPYAIGRYVIASAPALALLVATAVRGLDRALPVPSWRRAPLLGPTAVVVALLLALGQGHLHRSEAADWRGAVRLVAAEAEPGDAVVFTYFRAPFDAAWHEAAPSVGDPPDAYPAPRPLGEVRRFDDALDWSDVDRRLAPYDRVWIVHHDRSSLDDPRLARVMGLPSLRGLVEVEHHSFLDEIEVTLLGRP